MFINYSQYTTKQTTDLKQDDSVSEANVGQQLGLNNY